MTNLVTTAVLVLLMAFSGNVNQRSNKCDLLPEKKACESSEEDEEPSTPTPIGDDDLNASTQADNSGESFVMYHYDSYAYAEFASSPVTETVTITMTETAPVESFYDWLELANLPEMWWDEFSIVAACESAYNPYAEGDGGNAKGLFQIHWQVLWADWANTNWRAWYDYAIENGMISEADFDERYDAELDKFYYFGQDEWTDPIKQVHLTWVINVFYDQPRGGFWQQWTGHPHISGCRTKRDQLDSSGAVLYYVNDN